MTNKHHSVDIDITGGGPEHWEELTPNQLADSNMSLWRTLPNGDAEHVGGKNEALAWMDTVAALGLMTEQIHRIDDEGETSYRVALA